MTQHAGATDEFDSVQRELEDVERELDSHSVWMKRVSHVAIVAVGAPALSAGFVYILGGDSAGELVGRMLTAPFAGFVATLFVLPFSVALMVLSVVVYGIGGKLGVRVPMWGHVAGWSIVGGVVTIWVGGVWAGAATGAQSTVSGAVAGAVVGWVLWRVWR